MPARARRTIPHGGPRPHREHRSRRGRSEDYQFRRTGKIRKAKVWEKAARQIDRELRLKASGGGHQPPRQAPKTAPVRAAGPGDGKIPVPDPETPQEPTQGQ